MHTQPLPAPTPSPGSDADTDLLSTLDAAWQHCPWGMAVIGGDGNVRRVNPAFERCTGIVGGEASALSEAALDAKLRSLMIANRRVEVGAAAMRAIHYIDTPKAQSGDPQRLVRVEEALREALASIYGFSELLLTQNYDATTRRELTATILGQVDEMASIISHHFDQARETR